MSKLSHVKKIIRSLLISSQEGLTPQQLQDEYFEMTNEVIPFKEYNLSDALAFFQMINDTVSAQFVRNKVMLFGIADKSTAKLQNLVVNQKKKSKKSGAMVNSSSSFSTLREKMFSLFRRHSKGMFLNEFEKLYSNHFGANIKWSHYNFMNTRHALSEMHDIVRLKIVGLDQIYIYQAADSKLNINNSSIKYLKHCIFDLVRKSGCGVSISELPELFQKNYQHALDLSILNSLDEFILTFVAGIKVQCTKVNGDFLFSMEDQKVNSIQQGMRVHHLRDNVSSLVNRFPSGIDSYALCNVYKVHFSQRLCLKRFSFCCLERLLFTMLDVISLENYNSKVIIKPKESSSLEKKLPLKPLDIVGEEGTYELPDLTSDGFVKVVVKQIVSPGMFFIKPIPKKTLTDVIVFEEDLKLNYSGSNGKPYLMQPSSVKKNKLCVTKHPKNSSWCRAIVMEKVNDLFAKVLLVDCGFLFEVSLDCIYHLKWKFLHFIPRQTVQVGLADIRPANSSCWTGNSKVDMELLCRNELVATVVDNEELKINLYDTTGSEDVCINNEMVRLGHASIVVQVRA